MILTTLMKTICKSQLNLKTADLKLPIKENKKEVFFPLVYQILLDTVLLNLVLHLRLNHEKSQKINMVHLLTHILSVTQLTINNMDLN